MQPGLCADRRTSRQPERRHTLPATHSGSHEPGSSPRGCRGASAPARPRTRPASEGDGRGPGSPDRRARGRSGRRTAPGDPSRLSNGADHRPARSPGGAPSAGRDGHGRRRWRRCAGVRPTPTSRWLPGRGRPRMQMRLRPGSGSPPPPNQPRLPGPVQASIASASRPPGRHTPAHPAPSCVIARGDPTATLSHSPSRSIPAFNRRAQAVTP